MNHSLWLTREEILNEIGYTPPSFPRYVAPLLNLANRFAGATRPRIVGQMSHLIHQSGAQTLEDWEEWYLKQQPDAIETAVMLIKEKLNQFREALDGVTDKVVRTWVRDLVIAKTYEGLKLQKVILRKVAETVEKSWRLSTPREEARGIDGYIGKTPISIKPTTWKLEPALQDQLAACVIFYQKRRSGIKVIFDESLIQR